MWQVGGMAGGGEAACAGASGSGGGGAIASGQGTWLNDWIGGTMNALTTGFINDWFSDNNAKTAFKRQQRLIEQQRQANESLYRNRYSWTVEDMRNAGLNPILAATGGFSVGSGPSVGLASAAQAQTIPMPAVGSSAKEFAETDKLQREKEKVEAETEEKLTQAALNLQKAKEALANTAKHQAEIGALTSQEKLNLEMVDRTTVQIEEIAAHIWKLKAETQAMAARRDLDQAETWNVMEQNKLIKSEIDRMGILNYQLYTALSELQKRQDVWKGPAGGVLGYVKEIMGAVGILPVVGGALVGRGMSSRDRGSSRE